MSKNKLNTSDFVHLHNHTQYSLLDGLTKVPELVDYVKASGMKAVAITDHGTLSGLIEMYKAARTNDIKPILGMEAYVAPRSHTDKDVSKDKINYHLVLLAMNNEGYRNLMRLSTIANLEGFYYRPRIDRNLLKKYNKGLIVLSGCIGGEVGDNLRNNQYAKAKKVAQWYKNIFGDRYYLEIQDHGHPDHPSSWAEQVDVTKHTLKLAKELNIDCVVTSDAHYLKHEDQEAHEVLLCVQTNSFLADKDRFSLKDFQLHVTDPKEIIKRWGSKYPDLIKNTSKIADRCKVEIELGKILIPKFEVPKGYTTKVFLDECVYRGLIERYSDIKVDMSKSIDELKKNLSQEILERAEYELGIIENMGFNEYFLIIADFINWGKERGIVFGPGRGSAAGSIVAYALKVTEIDPIKYDLLFERFLNPDRISMPDIDVDIQDSRRDEVIQYCVDKYGKDRVANIVTFGRMAARNAVRDTARVLQVPYAEADRLAKMIPPPVQGRHIPLKVSLQKDKDLKKEYDDNETAKKIFDLAIQLEGTIRSHGVHAAGVVIAPGDIVDYTPLEMAQKGVVSTQYSMNPIEELGLLKMDFLGLSNLTIIKNALRIIKKVYDKDIDINKLPLDDKKTFQLLSRGDTTGVFQLESAGMKRYLKQLKPNEFEDIVAICALYRPGPLGAGLTDSFIKRKNGLEDVSYEHESMKPALETTYGVLVYQEQVMQISKEVCGFSGGDADTLRKAIGKKIREVMQKMEKKFIDGGVEHSGVPRQVMENFWHHLLGFADYCFNKSHSACYALIAYWTAYLKAHYPEAFMAALMTSDYDDIERLAIEITECRHMGIEVLPPDVNESFLEFAVVPGKRQIRFGMAAIKNVGTGAVEEILRAREKGKFDNLESFFASIDSRIVNKKTIESLIKSGALDSLEDREVLLNNIENIVSYSARVDKEKNSSQTDLFGNEIVSSSMRMGLNLDRESRQIYTDLEKLAWEKALLGLYLSTHPIDSLKDVIDFETLNIFEIKKIKNQKPLSLICSVLTIKEINTKNGSKMAFLMVGDQFDEIEAIVFPGTYDKVKDQISEDNILMINAKPNFKDGNGDKSADVKLVVEEVLVVEPTEEFTKRSKEILISKEDRLSKKTQKRLSSNSKAVPALPKLYLRLHNSEDRELLSTLRTVLQSYDGDTEVVIVVGQPENKQAIKLPVKVDPIDDCLSELGSLVGSENVKLH
jgi:DNA polymerase III subunit alpha